MNTKLTYLKACFVGLSITVLCLVTCALPQNQVPVIQELLYPTEVPSSFDTTLMCLVSDPDNSKLRFQWSSENGSIRGEGDSIIWTAPAMQGIYKIGVRVNNISGMETRGEASVQVVPFYPVEFDPAPEINLKLPVSGSGIVSKQILVTVLTTAEINCDVPEANNENYKYTWWCNGGKIVGVGVKDGTASKIGWIATGVPGYYTITVKVTDNRGAVKLGSVYFNVQSTNTSSGQFRWKK